MCAPEQPNYFIFNGPNCPSMYSRLLPWRPISFQKGEKLTSKPVAQMMISKSTISPPNAYFGMCAPEQPNYFIFNGPNCPSMYSLPPTIASCVSSFGCFSHSSARLLPWRPISFQKGEKLTSKPVAQMMSATAEKRRLLF
jgi:hypothetical protein